MNWSHWIVVPVVLPLIAGAACLLLERRAASTARAQARSAAGPPGFAKACLSG